jgi:hypothetical protein
MREGLGRQQRRWRAAERRHPTGCERMGSSTLQTLQEPILLPPCASFRDGGFPNRHINLSLGVGLKVEVRAAPAACSALCWSTTRSSCPSPPASPRRRRRPSRARPRRLLSKVNTHLSKVNTHLSKANTHLSKVNTHLSKVNTHLSKVNTHLSTVNTQLSTVNTHLQRSAEVRGPAPGSPCARWSPPRRRGAWCPRQWRCGR